MKGSIVNVDTSNEYPLKLTKLLNFFSVILKL